MELHTLKLIKWLYRTIDLFAIFSSMYINHEVSILTFPCTESILNPYDDMSFGWLSLKNRSDYLKKSRVIKILSCEWILCYPYLLWCGPGMIHWLSHCQHPHECIPAQSLHWGQWQNHNPGRPSLLELLSEKDVIGVHDDLTLWVVILRNA